MSYVGAESFCTQHAMAAILHDCRFAGGISASGQSAGFGGNLFTRDTCRVLRDVIGLRGFESFVREMLGTLPQWQGIKEDPATNELPDALQHQVFRQIVGGRILPDMKVNEAKKWTDRWGVEMENHPTYGRQFVIYNSSDGPLLYLITLGEFCQVYGKSVLGDSFLHHPTGEYRTVADAARRCVSFILRALRRGEESHGLYGVSNTNPAQTSPSGVMRDGFDAYVRADGTAADYATAVYVENQALAYHALTVAAEVLFPEDRAARTWLGIAQDLRLRAIGRLWTGDFFAAAIDTHGLVDMLSSAAFELLDSPFFDNLEDGPDYIRALVTRLYSSDFMTPIGVRMTSRQHEWLEGRYYAYQGSSAVWGVTNGGITRGLLRNNLPFLAYDLGIERLVSWIDRAGEAYEMTFIDRATGEPLFKQKESGTRAIFAAEMGQPDQAWSASAALRLLSTDFGAFGAPRGSWQASLQRQMRERVEAFPIARAVSSSSGLYVDLEEGERLKKERAAALGVAT